MNVKRCGRMGVALAVAWVSVAAGVRAGEDETAAQRDARMKWWREARFGMFIHWGVYSVPAGTYQGKQIAGIGEWIMNRGKIPVAEYKKYAARFNPVKYNAEEWVKLAKTAGMKYMVITSKHHDGFAMFDSKASDWCIARATPFQRDPLKELADACKKHGMRLGFYYSQAQDWCHPGGAAAGGHWDKAAQDGSMDEYIKNIAVPQVREILSNYGPVAVLWWDTPTDMNKDRAELLLPLLKLQPGIIQNNRLGGGYRGDTETPEQFIPPTGYPGRDWETCMTMNDTWGYKSYDHKWKPVETLVRNLIDIASKGGNYLLNVGPTDEGLIPEPSVERLKQVGKWMDRYGEAVYGTTASPFKRLPGWLRCTKKVDGPGATLYVHLFSWPDDGAVLLPGLKNNVESVRLLADPEKTKLHAERADNGVQIRLAGSAPNPIASVVEVRLKGNLDVEQTLQTQEPDGRIVLAPSDAVCHGAVKYETHHHVGNVGYWTNAADWIEWPFMVARPGKFAVTVELSSQAGGGKFQVAVGGQKVEGQAPKTGDYAKYQKVELGIIEIPAGKTALAVKALPNGWKPMNLRSLVLKPKK